MDIEQFEQELKTRESSLKPNINIYPTIVLEKTKKAYNAIGFFKVIGLDEDEIIIDDFKILSEDKIDVENEKKYFYQLIEEFVDESLTMGNIKEVFIHEVEVA